MIDPEFMQLLKGIVAIVGLAALLGLLANVWLHRNDNDPPLPPSGGDKIVQDYDQLLAMLKREYMRGKAAGFVEGLKERRKSYS